jgi:ADP-heptose:LPS heptosyltransferase
MAFDPARIASVLVYVSSDPDDAIGENLMKLPMLHALRAVLPSARLTWAHGAPNVFLSGPLSPFVEGRIDEIVSWPDWGPDDVSGSARIGPLKGRRFDLVIDTQERLRRTLMVRPLARRHFLSLAWRGRLSTLRVPAPPRNLPRRLLALTRALGAPDPDPPIALPPAYHAAAAALIPDPRVPHVAIAPGAGAKEKRKCWPLDRFLELARRQTGRGRVPVLYLGPGEADWLAHARAEVPGALFPWPDHRPPGLKGIALDAAIASRLAGGVANCAGPGHILGAGGARVLSLFGPTDAVKFLPWAGANASLRAQDFGGTAEMDAIPLQAVDDTLEALLAGRHMP